MVGWAMPSSKSPGTSVALICLVLRGSSLFATVSATLVMALDEQTKAMVVALIGNTPITASVIAKFQ